MQVEEKKGLEWRKSTNHVLLASLLPLLPEVGMRGMTRVAQKVPTTFHSLSSSHFSEKWE